MRIIYFCVLLVAGIGWTQCTTKGPTHNATDGVSNASHPDAAFMDFYEKFHQDSVYQMAHITWPLEGVSLEQRDSTHAVEKKMWEPQNWRMHRLDLLKDANAFEREWQLLGDVLITERLRWRAANFYMERRFAKQSDGEWALIYYADVLEMAPLQRTESQ